MTFYTFWPTTGCSAKQKVKKLCLASLSTSWFIFNSILFLHRDTFKKSNLESGKAQHFTKYNQSAALRAKTMTS